MKQTSERGQWWQRETSTMKQIERQNAAKPNIVDKVLYLLYFGQTREGKNGTPRLRPLVALYNVRTVSTLNVAYTAGGALW